MGAYIVLSKGLSNATLNNVLPVTRKPLQNPSKGFHVQHKAKLNLPIDAQHSAHAVASKSNIRGSTNNIMCTVF